MDRAERATLFAVAGINAGLGVLRILAMRGQVSPDEVDEFANGITNHLAISAPPSGLAPADALAYAEKMAAYVQLSATVEAQTAPWLAEIRQYAAETWKGDPDNPDQKDP